MKQDIAQEWETNRYIFILPLIVEVGNIVDVLFGVIYHTPGVATVIPAVFSVKPGIDDSTFNQRLCTSVFLKFWTYFELLCG